MAPRRSARLQAATTAEEETKPVAPVKKTRATRKVAAPKKKAAPNKKKSAASKNKSTKTAKTAKATQAAPSTPPRQKRAQVTPESTPTRKKRRTGLAKAVDSSAPLGVVDPESKIEGTIEVLDKDPCDVMMVLVDPSKNMDKYFVLQLIKREGQDDEYVVYTRWGRTGTSGQALEQDFDNLEGAQQCFEDKFKQKSGLTWEDRNESPHKGKYTFVKQDLESKQAGYTGATWQYWVDDGVDGKEAGWYDYDPEGSVQTERLFTEHDKNPSLTNRFVESGAYTYDVDLAKMTQTNVVHPNRTSRHIRRCPAGEDMPDDAPSSLAPKSAASTLVTPPATPAKKTAAKATPVKSATPAAPFAPGTKKKSGSHPVDPDVSLHRRKAADFEVVQNDDGVWYDVVLNQCNIANNNNKYYRIQMLKRKGNGQLFVWQKWGRVGESARASASAFKGPFPTVEKAFKEFGKKYKDKTANAFDADTFVARYGKYTPIEIDNDVEVDEQFEDPSAKKKAAVEYLPSVLEKKTQELIETLFSKEMRDDALVSFNLDLKKLPLGVPSEQQIQHGITILNQIEDRLNGGSGQGYRSYSDLSSEFYTAIPHSFGRQRPPTISSRTALQSRYDMCNILLDMYATNQTLRKIEKEETEAEVDKVPSPVDKHYDSLSAKLSLVDKKSKEYKLIEKYFKQTKSKNSNSTLMDVWEVDRNGEKERFEKFGDTSNRRLLWHGTNIAVVAPILTSGLRIMPHSGGRVGAGIYLASMQEKSEQYTSGYGAKFGCMFLAEAALGKMHEVTQDGQHAYSLKKAPAGFDSVHAVGKITPDNWETMDIEGNEVQIPQSQSKDSGVQSSFHHDEFLAYDEAQVRLRYVMTVKNV